MYTPSNRAKTGLIWLSAAAAVVAILVLAREEMLLQEQLDAQLGMLTRATEEIRALQERSDTQAELDGRLREEVAQLRAQVSDLADDISQRGGILHAADAPGGAAHSVDPLSLAPGFYVLTPAGPNGTGTTDQDSYTNYHLVANVRTRQFEQLLHFGAAGLGWFDWQFYFDYDSDGRIDTEMVREFADTLPLGSYLSSAFDADRSQNAYERFLSSSDAASFTPLERIASDGSAIAQQLWNYVDSRSEDLASWIRNRVQLDQATIDKPRDPTND